MDHGERAFALAGPFLARIGIAGMMKSWSEMHPAAVLFYPAAPFIWAGKGLGIEANEATLTLAAALGYGNLPLLTWGAWTAWSAYRTGIRSWRRERA